MDRDIHKESTVCTIQKKKSFVPYLDFTLTRKLRIVYFFRLAG